MLKADPDDVDVRLGTGFLAVRMKNHVSGHQKTVEPEVPLRQFFGGLRVQRMQLDGSDGGQPSQT